MRCTQNCTPYTVRTYPHRDGPCCQRTAIREFTNGEALCAQHLERRLAGHRRVVERIRALGAAE